VVRKADGSHYTCALPGVGEAFVLQGGRLDHAISPTTSPLERLTMITSYRPCDPLAPDTCKLCGVRTVSDMKEVNRQWMQYRLRILTARAEYFSNKLKQIASVEAMARFADAQMDFLNTTIREMVIPPERVPTNGRLHYIAWAESHMNSNGLA